MNVNDQSQSHDNNLVIENNSGQFQMGIGSALQGGLRFVSSALSRVWSKSPAVPENLILHLLGKDVLLLIFKHLEGMDLVAASLVCQKFRRTIPKSSVHVEKLFFGLMRKEKKLAQSTSSFMGGLFFSTLQKTEEAACEPFASFMIEAKALCLLHGEMTRALRLADRCLHLPSRIRLLVAIGKKAEKVGTHDLALRVFDGALNEAIQFEAMKTAVQVEDEVDQQVERAAKQIINEWPKDEELDPVAYVLSSLYAGNPEKTLMIARGLKGNRRKAGMIETQKDFVLQKLFDYWVMRNLGKAITIAEEMEEKNKNNALSTILGHWDVKDENGAFKIARKINKPFERLMAIANFVILLVPDNPDRAFEIANQAEIYIDDFELGEFNHTNYWKELIHCHIIRALAPHHAQRALQLLLPRLINLNDLRTLSSIVSHLDQKCLTEVHQMSPLIERDMWLANHVSEVSGLYRELALAYIPHNINIAFELANKLTSKDLVILINALVSIDRKRALDLLDILENYIDNECLIAQTLAQHGEIEKAMTKTFDNLFLIDLDRMKCIIEIYAKSHPSKIPTFIAMMDRSFDNTLKKMQYIYDIGTRQVAAIALLYAPYHLERSLEIASEINEEFIRLTTYKRIGEIVFSEAL